MQANSQFQDAQFNPKMDGSIHIGGMCLIPLCDHQNGNRWTGPFLPYFKSNTCPLGEIQTMQKSERKKHS